MHKEITGVIQAANGRWAHVLSTIGIHTPKKGKHGPCPVCGGKDRFRFDDLEGRGTWICNQCDPKAGDGLQLITNVSGVSPTNAAKQVAVVLGFEFGQLPPDRVAENQNIAEGRRIEAQKKKERSASQAQCRANQINQHTQLGESIYLKNKGIDFEVPVLSAMQGISVSGIDFNAGDIFLPIFNSHDQLVNGQLINRIGDKRFLPSGRKSGCFHVIKGEDELVAVAEGYATALTVHQATKATTYVAFDCGNLKSIAKLVKARHSKAKIIICGDNDSKTDGNPGKTKAEEVAEVIGATAKVPSAHGDWNDFFQNHGMDETSRKLLALQSTPSQSDEAESRIHNKQLEPWELDRLRKIGKEHSHIVVGARHRVMIWKHCPVDGIRPTFESVNEFQNYFLHLPEISGLNQGKAWINWPGKIFYSNGIGYYPDTQSLPLNCYNLFRGWGVEPIESAGLDLDPDLAIIKSHLRDVICDGHEESYLYLVGWLAQMVQDPSEKPPVAILMKSVEGSGKGTLYEIIKSMLGSNAYQVNGNGQLVGRFNSIIDGRLFVFGDEVDMTDKRQYDKLKSLISEKTQSVERKGLEPEPVRVLARFMFTGNHDHLIKAGTNERRWLVLEPSPAKQDDSGYWNHLYKAIRGSAPAKLLYHLLTLDLTDFKVRRPPVTQGLIDQKLASLKIQEVWIYEELSSRSPFDGRPRITAAEVVDNFIEFAQSNGDHKTKPQARSLVGKMMVAAGLTVTGRSDRGGGARYYDIPPVSNMREAFAGYLKHKPDEIF